MPRSSKRASSRPSGNKSGASNSAAKKLKTAAREDNEDTNVSAVSPIADPDAAPSSSAQVKAEEEPAVTENHKAILAILAVLASIKSTPDAAEKGFAFMATLVENNNQEDLMERIIDDDGIALIATTMKDHPDKQGLQQEGRALLKLLCKAVKEQKDEKGIKSVLTVMQILPFDVLLLEKCCNVLWVAAFQHDNSRKFIGESGGIPLIVASLKNHPNEKVILDQGLGALANLTCYCDANIERVVDADGITVMVDTLKRNPNNVNLQNGITVLLNLAWKEEHVKPIMEAGGHEAVVKCMNNHQQNVRVQMRGCWAIANLAFHSLEGVCKQIAEAGAIPTVVKAVKTHSNSLEVVKRACRALFYLSKGDEKEVQKAIVQAGGLEALGTIIRLHSPNNEEKDFVKWAKQAIHNCIPIVVIESICA